MPMPKSNLRCFSSQPALAWIVSYSTAKGNRHQRQRRRASDDGASNDGASNDGPSDG